MRDTIARYNGTCAGCGHPIHRGNRIAYYPETRKTYHIEHAPRIPEQMEWADKCFSELVKAGLGKEDY